MTTTSDCNLVQTMKLSCELQTKPQLEFPGSPVSHASLAEPMIKKSCLIDIQLKKDLSTLPPDVKETIVLSCLLKSFDIKHITRQHSRSVSSQSALPCCLTSQSWVVIQGRIMLLAGVRKDSLLRGRYGRMSLQYNIYYQ